MNASGANTTAHAANWMTAPLRKSMCAQWRFW